jgi:dihydroorotase
LTTKDGVDYVREAEGPIGATITPQHLLYNRNAIFTGGLRPHWYCLPVLKRETHRLALVQAATSDSPRFFLGTDSAPHARPLKEHGSGCAGCYSALHAMTLYATAFDSVGRLDRLEAFASHRGPDFYGLPRNSSTITLVKQPYHVPNEVPFGKTVLVPLASGETFAWRLQSTD